MSSISRYKKWAWVFHVLFWSFFGALSYLVYSIVIEDPAHALIPTSVNLVGLIIMVYTHLHFLLPRYFAKKKYLIYLLGLVVLLLLTSTFRFYTGLELIRFLGLNYESFFTPTYFGSAMATGAFVLVLTLPLYLVENWFKKIELENELKTQQLEAELRFLKAQVNPHFLFNVLNNIYSLSFTQSDKAPEMILKLSEMMSYMLYECKSEKVKLSSEITYLKNYIDLQQLKKEGEQNIDFQVSDSSGNLMITPMLFIPFFENVFKHGNLEDTKNGWLKSEMNIKDGKINFNISNSYNAKHFKKQLGGVGLENIKKRLALIYPNQYSLSIENTKNTFSVELNIYPKKQVHEIPMPDSG